MIQLFHPKAFINLSASPPVAITEKILSFQTATSYQYTPGNLLASVSDLVDKAFIIVSDLVSKASIIVP